MCKFVTKNLLFLVAAVVMINILISVKISARQTESRAEAFRKSLSAKNMIVPKDSKFGSARSIAITVEVYSKMGIFDLKRCGLKGFRDTPDYASPEYLNTFAIKLRGKNHCAGISDRAACAALRNNCLTIGTSIFCDYDYLVRLRNLARSAYFYAQMGIKDNVIPLMLFHTDLLMDFGKSQLELQQISESEEPKNSPSERAAYRYARENHSMMLEMMEYIAVGFVIAHELAHVEQNTNVETIIPDLDRKTQDYYNLTCHTSIQKKELKADLRGIEMAAELMEWQHMLTVGGYGDHIEKDSVLARMWEDKSKMGILSLYKILEYELIVGQDPYEGTQAVSTEPFKGSLELVNYYDVIGEKRTKKEHEMLGQVFESKHMDFSFRAILLLEKAGIKDYIKDQSSIANACPRFIGFTIGRLAALQEFRCGKSFDEAHEDAWKFLLKSYGVQ